MPGQRVTKSLLWAFTGAGARTVTYTLVLVVLARLLTPRDFGILAAALIVVRISNMFSQLGVGPAIIQRAQLQTVHLRTGVSLSVLFGICFGALVFLSAPLFAAFLHIEELLAVLRIMSVIFPIQALSVVADSLLQREMRFRRIAMIELASVALGYGAGGISLALAGYGVWALVAAQLMQTSLRTTLFLLARPHSLLPLLDREAARELMYFGTGLTGGRICVYLAGQSDSLVVGRWLGATALGLYGRAHQLMVSPVVLFSMARDKVLFSKMASMQSDSVRLGDAYRRGVTLTAVVVLPVSVVLCILTPDLVPVLFGPGWSGVVAPGQILALGIVLQSGHRLSDSLIKASGMVYRSAWRQGLYAALVILGTWVGQRWGIAGAAVGVLVALTIHYFIMAQLSLSITNGTWSNFAFAHLPSLGMTSLVGSVAWGTSCLLRVWSLPSAVVLLTTLATTGISLLLVRLRPEFFLGEDGTRVLKHFRNRLRSVRTRPPQEPPMLDEGSVEELPDLATACVPQPGTIQ